MYNGTLAAYNASLNIIHWHKPNSKCYAPKNLSLCSFYAFSASFINLLYDESPAGESGTGVTDGNLFTWFSKYERILSYWPLHFSNKFVANEFLS